MLDIRSDFDDYQKLKTENVSSIRREDLPSEFGDEAFRTVDEFIKKTRNLDYEFVIYFDYVTGEILKCAKGIKNNVKITFGCGEFEGHHVASIHNHTKDSYSPPSDRNFGVLIRDFEDYELVASVKELWILKSKDINPLFHLFLKEDALSILKSCQDDCDEKYSDSKKANEICDIMYGVALSNYINDKNIKDIQITKVGYD